jgi:hypothetical protein
VIIEFKSKASGAFFMTEPVAKMVFAAIGVAFAGKGIFTEDQVPGVRAKLAQAIDQSRAQDRARLSEFDEAMRQGDAGSEELPVGLSQRAYPLLEMLEAAEKNRVPVVWGV